MVERRSSRNRGLAAVVKSQWSEAKGSGLICDVAEGTGKEVQTGRVMIDPDGRHKRTPTADISDVGEKEQRGSRSRAG